MDGLKKKLLGKTQRQYELSLDDIAALIKAGSVKNIVVCAGAGISTSAGIPDFRSPETGLYHNLKRLKLDYPEQVFDIDFFRRKPEPFYELAHELYPGKFLPTLTHSFIRLLHEKGILLRCFTQNIDTLERRSGIPAERIVEAHGSFATNHCISSRCGIEADSEKTKQMILQKRIPRCHKCKGLVKPDIVFFGEGLPDNFFKRMSDFKKADLIIVLGTSLQVQPFASLPDKVNADCPRLLLNLEEVGHFDRELDVVVLDKCDAGVARLASACGWKEDLQKMDEKVKREAAGEQPSPESRPTDTAIVQNTDESKVVLSAVRDEELGKKDDIITSDSLHTAKDNVDVLAHKLKGTNL